MHVRSHPHNDLARRVYCVLGLPIDALDMQSTLHHLGEAVAIRSPFLISTPNLNFLVNARSDPEFRESVLQSDLCPADGMSVVWIARLIGAPIHKRVSGSDIFDALKAQTDRPVRVFLFGGEKNVAVAAQKAINAARTGMSCVGTLFPGFGTIEEMSQNHILDEINGSGADFLVVALGAQKGQLWLYRNHARLTIPVRAHLGAVMNFEAGTVKRAPTMWRRAGLEWLWRIKEEPKLWSRYWRDGTVLMRLLLTRVLPLAIANRSYRVMSRLHAAGLKVRRQQDQDNGAINISLAGDAVEQNIVPAIDVLQDSLSRKVKSICIDLSQVRIIDLRFLGLLMMLRKEAIRHNAQLTFIGVSSRIRRLFGLSDAEHLLG